MIFALLAAIEKQEKQCNKELLMEVIAHDRVDLLERLFSQKSFIKTDSLIRTLLHLSFDNCAKFLKEKLELVQAGTDSNNCNSAVEEQAETDSSDADNRHRFLDLQMKLILNPRLQINTQQQRHYGMVE